MDKLTRREFSRGVAAGIAWLGLGRLPLFAADEEEFFSIAVLPDTQYYSESHPDIFTAQTRWIVNHRDEHRIAFVAHEGDITNRNNEEQWRNADRSLSLLDDAVPYGLAVGNHDMGPGGSARNRDTTLFNRHFTVSRFDARPSYGGHFGLLNDNSFHLFRACGMDFLVLCLEFGARDAVLEWAADVLRSHPAHRAILVTHAYMYWDDTRVGPGDDANPHNYRCGGNDGEEMWEKLVRRHPTLFLVLSGHICGDGVGRLESPGDGGNRVHQLLANYQMKDNGGSGWLRLMKFVPARNRIEVSTHSPFLTTWAEDDDNRFALEYGMR